MSVVRGGWRSLRMESEYLKLERLAVWTEGMMGSKGHWPPIIYRCRSREGDIRQTRRMGADVQRFALCSTLCSMLCSIALLHTGGRKGVLLIVFAVYCPWAKAVGSKWSAEEVPAMFILFAVIMLTIWVSKLPALLRVLVGETVFRSTWNSILTEILRITCTKTYTHLAVLDFRWVRRGT